MSSVSDIGSVDFWNDILSNMLNTMFTMFVSGGIKILLALILFFIGWIIIKIIMKIINKLLSVKKLPENVHNFVLSLIKFCLYMILLLVILGALNIEALSIGSIFAALAFAVAAAMGDAMQNFVAGLLIIFNKPMIKGDYVETQGHEGFVELIGPMKTTLLSPENHMILVANGPVVMEPLVNYNKKGIRRVDLVIGIQYCDDIATAKMAILKVMKNHPDVISKPKPSVNVTSLGDDSVNLAVRPWCACADYWTVYFQIQELSKIALEAAGCGCPFPQRDVHLIKDPPASKPKNIDWSFDENDKASDSESSEDGIGTKLKGVGKKVSGKLGKLAKRTKKLAKDEDGLDEDNSFEEDDDDDGDGDD